MDAAMRIVIIEDDTAQREMLTQILTRSGFQVQSAQNGRQGLEMLEELRPDLVLTDILMPEADGLEVIRTLKRRMPNTPILAMSGGGNMIPANMGLEFALVMGADGILNKPYTLHELMDAIRHLLPHAESLEWLH